MAPALLAALIYGVTYVPLVNYLFIPDFECLKCFSIYFVSMSAHTCVHINMCHEAPVEMRGHLVEAPQPSL